MKKLIIPFLVAAVFYTSARAAISQIRWGSTGDPLNGLNITWTSTGTADSIRWGYTSSFENGRALAVRRNSYASARYFFTYMFPGSVKPNSIIYYALYDSDLKSWGQQKTYSTAQSSDTKNFTFLAIGDSRNGLAVWKKVSELANTKKAALTVFNGDIVDNGGSAGEWDDWFNSGAAYLEKNVVYHALGNHDEDNVDTKKFFENIFELPKNSSGSELYSATKYGNVLFITLNSEVYGSNGDPKPQADWLATELQKAKKDPSILWTVVSHHRPHLNIGQHNSQNSSFPGSWKPVIWKVYDDYGVDLVLNGHDHNYQRTKPVNLKVSASAPVSKYGSEPGEGRCQIICGGAGAPLYPVSTSNADAWAMEKYQSVDNFVLCEVSGCKMTVTAYKADGSVLDNFVLDKTGTAACKLSGDNHEINEAKIFNSIQIIPNPTTGIFRLDFNSQDIGKGTINIFDFSGNLVYTKQIEKTEPNFSAQYDLSSFSKGIYNLQIIVNGQTDNALIMVN